MDTLIIEINAVFAGNSEDAPPRYTVSFTVAMSPHKLESLPSTAALPQYGISQNGFLPAEAPLTRLPYGEYEPWELIMDELPDLILQQQIRKRIDDLPVVDARFLQSGAEFRRAYSILAVMAQGYIWTGPEPSEVSQ